MTTNYLTDNNVTLLLNRARLARDNAERADNRVDHSFYYALVRALEELKERRAAPAVQVESILRDFYSAYGEWIDSGAPEGKPFARCGGLCANLFDYVASTVLEDLHAEFVAAGLDEKLPFNASESEYTDESGRGECHINHARVAWVRARIADGAAPTVQVEQLSGNTEHVSQPYKLRDAVTAIRNSGIAIDAGKIQAERDALNSPDYLQGYKDGCEWSALMAEANHPQTGDWLFDDPVELAKAIRKGPDMLPAAPDFRGIPNSSTNNCRENAETSTKCWIPVSERMPEPKSERRVCVYTPTPHEDMRYRFVPASLFKTVCSSATHWYYMEPPAAPQQEAE